MQRVHLRHDIDVVRLEAELVRHDLRRDRRVALSVWRAAQPHRHLAVRIDRHHGAGIGAGFAIGAAALFGRLRQRHIGHVRARRLDTRRKADAE